MCVYARVCACGYSYNLDRQTGERTQKTNTVSHDLTFCIHFHTCPRPKNGVLLRSWLELSCPRVMSPVTWCTTSSRSLIHLTHVFAIPVYMFAFTSTWMEWVINRGVEEHYWMMDRCDDCRWIHQRRLQYEKTRKHINDVSHEWKLIPSMHLLICLWIDPLVARDPGVLDISNSSLCMSSATPAGRSSTIKL